MPTESSNLFSIRNNFYARTNAIAECRIGYTLIGMHSRVFTCTRIVYFGIQIFTRKSRANHGKAMNFPLQWKTSLYHTARITLYYGHLATEGTRFGWIWKCLMCTPCCFNQQCHQNTRSGQCHFFLPFILSSTRFDAIAMEFFVAC